MCYCFLFFDTFVFTFCRFILCFNEMIFTFCDIVLDYSILVLHNINLFFTYIN